MRERRNGGRPSTRLDLVAVSREKPCYELATRTIQVIGTGIGLVLLSPAMLLIAVLIKLTGPGPVFYRGARLGKGGRKFIIYKFRTMVMEAENRIGGRLLSAEDHHLVTPLGRILKKTKLDELPQLWNVLKGDMNLVGPRPVRAALAEEYRRQVDGYDMRFLVRPGMSGLAQIRGGYFSNPRRKLRYELLYIKNRTLLLDLKYVLLAFFKVGERVVSAAAVMLGLLALVSFTPAEQLSLGRSSIQGMHIDNIYILIVIAGVAVLLGKRRRRRLFLYRTPIDFFAAAFVLLGFVSALCEVMRFPPLRGLAFYAVTGLLIFYVVLNTRISGRLDLRASQTVAILGMCVALGAMLPVVLTHTPAETLALLSERGRRLEATFRNPTVLAAYLTMIMPLLAAHMLNAASKRHRVFWGAGLAVVFTALVLTFTRGALVALAAGGAVFTFAKSKRMGMAFLGALASTVLAVVVLGGPRFSVAELGSDLNGFLGETFTVFQKLGVKEWLIGAGPRNLPHRPDLWPAPPGTWMNIGSMHLLLVVEHGILGWGLMMALIGAALREMWKLRAEIQPAYRQDLLLALCSSFVASLVLMITTPLFSVISLQVLFWGLLGLGLGIVAHRKRGIRGVTVIWKFGPE